MACLRLGPDEKRDRAECLLWGVNVDGARENEAGEFMGEM